MKRKCAIFGMLALLAGCIDVEDFDDTWKMGFTDPCVSAIVSTDYFDQKPDNVDLLLTNVALGKAHFMLTKNKPEDKGGSMIRYEVTGGEFVTYGLNKTKREDFKKEFPTSGIRLGEDTVTIPRLDDRSRKLVETVSGRADYWEETDRKPYNPTGNPACKQ